MNQQNGPPTIVSVDDVVWHRLRVVLFQAAFDVPLHHTSKPKPDTS